MLGGTLKELQSSEEFFPREPSGLRAGAAFHTGTFLKAILCTELSFFSFNSNKTNSPIDVQGRCRHLGDCRDVAFLRSSSLMKVRLMVIKMKPRAVKHAA